MLNSLKEEIFFSEKLKIRKKYTNTELKLYQYFYEKTKRIYPENVIVINNFIFFFVGNEYYFKVKLFLHSLRKELNKKVLIIRAENTLINLLFGFFPDIYIHDVKLKIDEDTGLKCVLVYFLSFEERAIAVGCNGEYIKAVNYIFDNYVIFKNHDHSLKIKCELICS